MTRAAKWQAFSLAAVLALVPAPPAALRGAPKKPVYVGARACGACHTGKSMGDQYSRWLSTKHAYSYTALARPEAKQIAAISGLRAEPQQAPICLGCHATASQAESWERDDGFHIEDGVQCESCHGPGSEYMEERVMRDRAAAVKAGLLLPGEQQCMTCHIEKGSHVAVLKSPQLDLKKALKEIAHPKPPNASPGTLPKPSGAEGKGPKYVGVWACAGCHQGPRFGHQFSLWRRSPHARAWAVLATPRSEEIARQRGLKGEPQKLPECLKCHSTAGQAPGPEAESFHADEGVGCEACHGPGSEYMHDAVMRDRKASLAAGLRKAPRETCAGCHKGSPGKPFDVDAAMKRIAHPTKLPPVADNPHSGYKNPLRLAVRPGRNELWVTLESAGTAAVVDTVKGAVAAEIPVGGNPTGIAFSPDGSRAYVTSRLDDSLSMLDADARKVLRTAATGDEPHGVLPDRAGKLLYVLNTSSNDISVFDAASLARLKTLSAGNGPWALALSPDGSRILVTNTYARFAPLRTPSASEVTGIETERGVVDERYTVPDANLMMGIAWHPSGRYALATLNRTKSLVPMTRLLQGWTITNGLAVIWKDGRVDQVLLDEPNMGFADATDVAVAPDGKYALVTSSGTDRVAVVDLARLESLLRRASPHERARVIPNHLGKATEFVVKHITVGRSPRGVVVAPDGSRAWVADSLDDSITVIDMARLEAAGRIDLGGRKDVTLARKGERLFHNAGITFRRQYSCHSCHPDGHVDRVTYDIEADGIGISPVDNRTLRGILDTAPFKWEGTNPSLQRQCGARLAVFFTRLAPFTPEELAAVDYYVTTIPRPPNYHRAPGAQLTPAQRRGRDMFERTTTADGRPIPPESRCRTCHNPPYFTDRQVHDVGTKQPSDRQGKFDTPHLNNIYDSAPYLHNGMAATLEEIWTVYNPDDRHGVTNDMTKDQLNDLIEYLKTL